MKKTAITAVSVVVLLLIWHIVALAMGSSILLPQPLEVLINFVKLFKDGNFSKHVLTTVLRALLSFVIITVSGLALGLAAGRIKAFRYALNPVVTLFKAVPMMSIILLAFIWFKTGIVPVFSAFLMGFPVMFVQIADGVSSIDTELEQVCTVYEIKGIKKLFNFTLPAILHSIITGSKQTLSMIWKVVIAAEVLTIPKLGIGRQLQLSQINLETSMVFAWTATAVLLTAAGDILFNFLLKLLEKRRNTDEN